MPVFRRTTVRTFGGSVQPLGGADVRLGGRREVLGSAGADLDLEDALHLKTLNIATSSLLGGSHLFAPGFGATPGVDVANVGGDTAGPGGGPGSPGDAPGPGEAGGGGGGGEAAP